jgi:hypothetical protein
MTDDLINRAVANVRQPSLADISSVAGQKIAAGQNAMLADNTQAMNLSSTWSASQTMSGGPDSSFVGNRQSVDVFLADRDYFFSMAVFERPVVEDPTVDSAPAAARWLAPTQPLVYGHSYFVRVTFSLNRYNGSEWKLDQFPVRISKQLSVWLEFGDARLNATEANRQVMSVPMDSPINKTYDFTIEIPADVLSTTAMLVLGYTEENSGISNKAAALSLAVEGTANAAPRPVEELRIISPEAKLPPETALLWVGPSNEPSHGHWLSMTGWTAEKIEPPNDRAAFEPPVKVDPFPDNAELTCLIKTIEKLADEDRPGLGRWLQKLLERYQKPKLIVVDEARSQLPWEMFSFDAHKYLGAHFAIARWSPLVQRGTPMVLPLDAAVYSGRLAPFLDQEGPAETFSRHALLTSCSPAGLEGFPRALIGAVAANSAQENAAGIPVAVIYLESSSPLLYGDEPDESLRKRYTSRTIALRLLEGKLNPQPIFFVNAPYSGREILKDSSPCGLLTAALRIAAAGYVGTIAPIERGRAAETFRQFCLAMEAGNVIRPSEFFRDIRKQAEEAFEKNSDHEAFRQAFSYVYYGDPGAQLKLGAATDVRFPPRALVSGGNGEGGQP